MPTVNYLWNPINDNIVREFDDDGNVLAEYTTEPDLHGAVISEHRDGVTYQHHYDAQGNTRALTNDQGEVTDTFACTAGGELTERTGTTPTPFQFGGEHGYYTDLETGQVTARRRDFDPPLGRWLSVDPLVDWMTWIRNTYGYASNDPVNQVDPSGLQVTRAAGDCSTAAADCAIALPFRFFGEVTIRWPCGSVSIDAGTHKVEWTGKGSCPSGVLGRTFVPRRIRAAVNKRLGVPRQLTTPCPDPCRCELTEFASFPIKLPFQTKQKIYCRGLNNLDCWDPEIEDTELPPEGAGYKECELDIKLQIELNVKLSGGTCK